ncbi:MAG: MotA/TolQ/ExbB proton channel family protein [Oligoflexia bacterium]
MLSQIFLGMSLLGAEWVLYVLVALSVISVSLMIERVRYYRAASRGLEEFRAELRTLVSAGRWDEAFVKAQTRLKQAESTTGARDMETEMVAELMAIKRSNAPGTGSSVGSGSGVGSRLRPELLNETAQDAVIRAKADWERALAVLATIGSNAPFVGLFGTVLGIIQAFHDLSRQAGGGGGIRTVTAGISEALIATAVGILVAIPAVVAFNLFQRRVKAAMGSAEALKSFLIGKISE